MQKNEKVTVGFSSLKSHDRDSFINDLQSINCEMTTSAASDDPNVMVSSFFDLFLAVLDVHVRLNIKNTKTGHAHAPWTAQGIRNSIRKRSRAAVKI